MRKILISSLTVLALASGVQAATKFYVDENGQVFTKPGEGRVELKSSTPWYSHSDKLKFSAQVYVGYKYSDYDAPSGTKMDADSKFELRRGYFQVKAYLLDDPKSYFRVTYDLHNDNGSMAVRAKYAYLYLNEVVPSTGLEIGLAHRPWHDYEEHNGWFYRSISKVLIETKRAGDLSNSADYGVMAKTRTKYFDSDIGIFNGEGYHSNQNSNGMSLEWRLTGHLLGTSSHHHPEKHTYADVSFFGQLNQKHRHIQVGNTTKYVDKDMNFYGVHAVYNMPSFLVAAQYVDSKVDKVDGKADAKSGKGWSVNTEARFGAKKEFKGFARYDLWTPEANSGAKEYDKKSYIIGAAWKMNKNVEWVVNATVKDYDKQLNTTKGGDKSNGVDYMLTAEINF